MSLIERGKKTEQNKTRKVGSFILRDLLYGTENIFRIDVPSSQYEKFLLKPINVYELNYGKHEILIEGFPVTGLELNALLFFNATYKLFGLDTNDLTGDWHNLYLPGNETLLQKHAEKYVGKENWKLFEKVRIPVMDLILKDQKNQSQSQPAASDMIRPIARITRLIGNRFSWNFEDIPNYEHKLMPILGPALLGAFSPDITNKWPRNMHNRSIGTTQVLPLTLMKRNDLFDGILFRSILKKL